MSTSSSNGGSRLLEHQLKQSSLSSKHEGSRLTEKADRLSSLAKRHREKAERLERKEKQLRGNATEAIRLHQSLEFEALCLALRRNDASTTAIVGTETFPYGYAQSLGDALDNNKHVSSIAICLETSIPSLFTDKSYCSNGMSSDSIEKRDKKYVAPLIKFLQTSKSLRRVKVHSSDPNASHGMTDVVGESYLGACFQNCNVEEIDVRDLEGMRSAAFVCCSYSNSSLKKLRLEFGDGYAHDDQDRRVIQNVFRNLSALSSLDLDCYDAELLVESILDVLRLHNSGMEELKLSLHFTRTTIGFLSTLSALLHSSSRMNRFSLAYMHFDLAAMRELINGLKQPGSASATTVRELCLTDCSFSDDTRRLLVEFMHTRAAPMDRRDRSSSLQKLTINGIESQSEWSSEELVSMLCMQQDLSSSSTRQGPAVETGGRQESCFYSTIGSQIESLSMGPIDEDYLDLFGVLAEHAQVIRLQTLAVSKIYLDTDVAALAHCISKIESLRSVDIRDLLVSARPILASLRANGKIHSASIQCSVAKEKEITAKLAWAYAKRNRHLDGILLESSTCSEQDGSDDTFDAIRSDRHTSKDQDGANPTAAGPVEPCNDGSKNKKSFAPTLWAAAQQVPQTEASKLLRSFLSLRESVGYK